MIQTLFEHLVVITELGRFEIIAENWIPSRLNTNVSVFTFRGEHIVITSEAFIIVKVADERYFRFFTRFSTCLPEIFLLVFFFLNNFGH